jgi:hypothetical protein
MQTTEGQYGIGREKRLHYYLLLYAKHLRKIYKKPVTVALWWGVK